MRLLYFDCFSGLAGDMTLAALIDLGLDPGRLSVALERLPLPPWRLEIERGRRQGMGGLGLKIKLQEEQQVQAHRSAEEIREIIQAGRLPPPVEAQALEIFKTVAEAEARAHGIPLAKVHFHELGMVDSVLDIVGSCYGLWSLGVERIEAAPPPLTRGFVRSAHGRIPLPAPATAFLLEGLPVQGCALRRELLTPTGAALLRVLVKRFGPIPEMQLERVGHGLGQIELPDRPNLLRLLLGCRQDEPSDAYIVEANLDDMQPEIAAHLLERLMERGALDAWFLPLQMKKGRPGLLLGALVKEEKRRQVEETLLRESSSLGLRSYPVSRQCLARRWISVETPWGPLRVKLGEQEGRLLNLAPEFEECRALARKANIPLKLIYQHAIAAALK